MILSELNKLLVNIANSNFLVHQAFVGDVYTINAKENRFGCFVATPMTAVKSGIGTIRYTYVLYYIDRLTKDEANIDFVQTDAVNLLKGVIEFLGENGVEIEGDYEFTLFRQKFDDWCAGAYVQVNILVPDNDCSEGIFNTDGIDLRPLVVDRNGIYEPGSFDGYNRVTINVPQVGATEAWVDDEIDLKLTGYATESWVSSQGYLTEHQDLSSYATIEYVGDAMDTLREEIPSLEGYASKNWVNNQGFLKVGNLADYVTQDWVENQGYLASIPSGYATKTWVSNQGFVKTSSISDMATQTWVSNQGYLVSDDISGFATRTWVGLQGYLVSDDLCSYATQSWVNQQGFLVSDDLCGYATEEWTRNWVTNLGYLSSCDLDPYATKNWVENQGYIQVEVLSSYATKNWVSSQQFATETFVNNQISVVQSWVLSQSYITSAALNGYATQTWVSNQGYLTSVPSEYATKSWCTSEFFEESKIWTGNQSQWESLTSEQQAVYTIALITEE